MPEHALICKRMLLNIILKNFFLSGVILEVFFQGFITDNLLFEFQEFLIANSFVRESCKNFLNSSFDTRHFMPDDWDAFDHVFSSVVFQHFFLYGVQSSILLFFLRRQKCNDWAQLTINLRSWSFILRVTFRYFKVNNIVNLFHWRQHFRVPSV